MVEYLFQQGANIEAQCEVTKNMVLDLIHVEQPEVFDKTNDSNSLSIESNLRLVKHHWCVEFKWITVSEMANQVELVMNRDFNQKGEFPLHIAVMQGHLDIIHILVESGADMTGQNEVKN